MNSLYTLKHRSSGHIGFVHKHNSESSVVFAFPDRKSANFVLQRLKYRDVLSQTKFKPPHTYYIAKKPAESKCLRGPLNKKFIEVEVHDPFDLNTYLLYNNVRLCLVEDIRDSQDAIVLQGSLMSTDGMGDIGLNVAILEHLFHFDKINPNIHLQTDEDDL